MACSPSGLRPTLPRRRSKFARTHQSGQIYLETSAHLANAGLDDWLSEAFASEAFAKPIIQSYRWRKMGVIAVSKISGGFRALGSTMRTIATGVVTGLIVKNIPASPTDPNDSEIEDDIESSGYDSDGSDGSSDSDSSS
ncbi:hypothetical protein [Methylocystis sp.]|uniref:hypothetical protein n=1 Tax=Methylocystis sp. TaxID=1911079 RepID=UPI0025D1D793|nr:hypothetical protein [Methylocystis sp.]